MVGLCISTSLFGTSKGQTQHDRLLCLSGVFSSNSFQETGLQKHLIYQRVQKELQWNWLNYTPGSTNIAGWKIDPLIESMYFLWDKWGIFQISLCDRLPEGKSILPWWCHWWWNMMRCFSKVSMWKLKCFHGRTRSSWNMRVLLSPFSWPDMCKTVGKHDCDGSNLSSSMYNVGIC